MCQVILCLRPFPDGVTWASICKSNWGRTEVSLVLATSSPSIESSLSSFYNCFFLPLLFFLSDILMAAVACNYVAIICFLASNWCSIAGMQSQIVSITLPLAWQAHLDYSQTSWSGDTLNVCLNFSWNPKYFLSFLFHSSAQFQPRLPHSAVCGTEW